MATLATLSPENETKLRQAIADANLTTVEDLIVSNAVECATMLTTEPDDYSQVGNSRYGGLPDLPVGYEWPQASGHYGEFLMQINLSNVPPFVGKCLPDVGMLYFFWDDREPCVCYVEADAELVKTFPPDYEDPDVVKYAADGRPIIQQKPWYAISKPHRLEIYAAIDLPEWVSESHSDIIGTLIDGGNEDGEDRYKEMARDFARRGLGDYDESWAGKLQGQPCWIGIIPEWDEVHPKDAPDQLFFALLNSNESVNMTYADAGYLLLYVPRAEVEARTFGGITMETESS